MTVGGLGLESAEGYLEKKKKKLPMITFTGLRVTACVGWWWACF